MPGPGELLQAPAPGELLAHHSGALAIGEIVTDPAVLAARLHLGGVIRGETIQFDVMQAWIPERPDRSLPLLASVPAKEASRCNLNCVEKYHCPAAFSLNPGLDPNSLAPAAVLVESITKLAEAALEARSRFFAPGGGFEAYCEDMNIPAHMAPVIREEELAKKALINLFGGNPEAHDYADSRADLTAEERTDLAMQFMAGYDGWQCYRNPQVGGCVQAGCRPARSDPAVAGGIAGLHPGCFWDQNTITMEEQIPDMSHAELADYVVSGRRQLAAESEAHGTRCPGCLFPTLMGGGKSIEAGMAPHLKPFYLKRRLLALGY